MNYKQSTIFPITTSNIGTKYTAYILKYRLKQQSLAIGIHHCMRWIKSNKKTTVNKEVTIDEHRHLDGRSAHQNGNKRLAKTRCTYFV